MLSSRAPRTVLGLAGLLTAAAAGPRAEDILDMRELGEGGAVLVEDPEHPPSAGGRFATVRGIGDFNADGLADYLIAAPGPIDPPGSVYLVWGAREPPERVELAKLRGRGLRLEGTIPTGNAEVPVGETGDFDGDGITDIAFSQRGLTDTRGRVHLIYGLSPSVEFIRGDADADGTLNITDAVYALSYLFLTGAVPPCLDAADTDDTGAVELTDAVYLLNHLFLRGPAPPPPYPVAGTDPTPDALGCQGF